MGVVTGDDDRRQQQPLTATEQAQLVREITADKVIGYSTYGGDALRRAFIDGWDAALEWVEEQRGKQA